MRDFKCIETLENGVVVTIRALTADDRERLVDAFRPLPPRAPRPPRVPLEPKAEVDFIVQDNYHDAALTGSFVTREAKLGASCVYFTYLRGNSQ